VCIPASRGVLAGGGGKEVVEGHVAVVSVRQKYQGWRRFDEK
jgi:hypothetical protein